MGVLKNCKPLDDLLEGNINLDIFTASLSQVSNHYRGKNTDTHSIYRDGEQFFKDGTYPTEGLKMVLRNVFSRIGGDGTAPSLQRLETAFGGGKTHTLIACTHLAYRGRELASLVESFIDPDILPEPGKVDVVAICGDEIPVRKNRGVEVVPYGLWDELAFQLGGERLCDEVAYALGRRDAPDSSFFDRIFSGRKALVMIDELAQYSARWVTAYPEAEDMVGSFLMSFIGYARRNTGISVVITLAGSNDAFINRTKELKDMLDKVSDSEIGEDESLSLLERSTQGISSVVARDATVVIPVHGNELSRVMAKRLFSSIDRDGAAETVKEYVQLYGRNVRYFPENVQHDDYAETMLRNYPFHPTIIDFLNDKLSTLSTFQGTRGVLRILSLAVRALWEKGKDVSMVHACHLDFHDVRTADEIIGRTQNNALLPVLNADIGGPDTDHLEEGRSNAQLADRENPHPEGIPMHEYVWRIVFLNSLVGQSAGLESNIFGLTEQEALMAASFPGFPPSQVQEALKAIEGRAYYLHFKNGRYYASTEPTLNVALSRIRTSLTSEQVITELEVRAREIVKDGILGFNVYNDVSLPEDIPEGNDRPQLGVVSIRVEEIAPEDFITKKGTHLPRKNQNLVFLLIPETASIPIKRDNSLLFAEDEDRRSRRSMELFDMARQILAMKRLEGNHDKYGITEKQLRDKKLKEQLKTKEQDLRTRLSQSYRYLALPSAEGVFAIREIRIAGGEGGQGIVQQIKTILLDEGKLFNQATLDVKGIQGVKKLFFGGANDIADLKTLRSNFYVNRGWPVVESGSLIDLAIREGITKGAWCLAGRVNDETGLPEELYSVESGGVPLELSLDDGCFLVTIEGIKKRGWLRDSGPSRQEIEVRVKEELSRSGENRVSTIKKKLHQWRDDIKDEDIESVLLDSVRHGKNYVYSGDQEESARPRDLVTGSSAVTVSFSPESVIVTKGEVCKRGWLSEDDGSISLDFDPGDVAIIDLIKQATKRYSRGASSSIDSLEISNADLPGGGQITVSISDASPKTMKNLRELLETLVGLVIPGKDMTGFLEINSPEEGCLMVKAIEERGL